MSVTAQPPDRTAVAWKAGDRWLLGVVLAVITFWLFAQTLLNVIPAIQGSLGLNATVANLAVSVTALMSGIFIVVSGGLADHVGRERVLRVGIVLSIAGSLLIALTPANQGALTATMIMCGRIVQGLSAACVMPSSLALIKAFYDGEARDRALSFWSIGSWGGSGFCSLFGGLMAASFLGWRSIFWISIAVALASLFLIRDTPDSRAADSASHHRFDWSGLVAFVVAMLAINVFISQGPRLGWFSGASLGLLVAFVVFILTFFRIETRKAAPFVDLSIFNNKTFAGATLSNFPPQRLGRDACGRTWSRAACGRLVVAKGGAVDRGVPRRHPGDDPSRREADAAIRPQEADALGYRDHRSGHPDGVADILADPGIRSRGVYRVHAVWDWTGLLRPPSTDAAMSSVPGDKAGAAAGIYKMASSLGSAFGVAMSYAIYTAGEHVPASLVPHIFWGRQDNVAMRFGGGLGLLFNVFMCVVALISIIVAVPDTQPEHERSARPQVPASPSLGS